MEKDKLQIALGAIEDLHAGSTKLAGMLDEMSKKVLSPADEAALRSTNTQIVSKLASMGELTGMQPDVAVESLMDPLSLAQMTLDMLDRLGGAKEASASQSLSLGRPAERKQAQADVKPVNTTWRKTTRC